MSQGGRAHRRAGSARTAAAHGGADEDPRAGKRAQIAQWRDEFRQLTGVDPKDSEAVKAWQAAHGVTPTGLVRAKTIAAARAAAKNGKAAESPAAEGGEASEGQAPKGDAKADEQPTEIAFDEGDTIEGRAPAEIAFDEGDTIEASPKQPDEAEASEVVFDEGDTIEASPATGEANGGASEVVFDEGDTIEGRAPTNPADVFSRDGNIAEGAGADEKFENPALMDQVTDGAAGMETHKDSDEAIKQTSKGVSGALKGGEVVGLIGDSSPWAKAAEVPQVVDLLAKGEVWEAVLKLAKMFGKSQAIKAAAYLAEKMRFEAASAALKEGGGVIWMLVEWTYQGFEQIQKAHAAGDQDSRIAIYAEAFADAFLFGSGAGNAAGAVTPEQKEAFALGNQDGAATAGATGEQAAEIGRALLAKHGGPQGARRAVINALMEKAGFTGLRF